MGPAKVITTRLNPLQLTPVIISHEKAQDLQGKQEDQPKRGPIQPKITPYPAASTGQEQALSSTEHGLLELAGPITPQVRSDEAPVGHVVV